MKERPILFSAPMVRALLDGSKTQTRRVCKPAEAEALSYVIGIQDPSDFGQRPLEVPGSGWFGDEEGDVQFRSPYGKPGDQLWVRESWHRRGEWRKPDWPEAEWDDAYWSGTKDVLYAAEAERPAIGWRGRPSIHMPRWASRIQLEIVSVRVERLQAISEADCWVEGIDAVDGLLDDTAIIDCAKRMGRQWEDAAPTYAALWESINGAGSWDANPWVWVVEFKVLEPRAAPAAPPAREFTNSETTPQEHGALAEVEIDERGTA